MPEELQESSAPGFDKEKLERTYNCHIDVDRAREVLRYALEKYSSSESGFFDDKQQAEEEYFRFLCEQGEDNEFLLNAVFLITSVTFGSKSSVFFDNLSKDPDVYKKYRWLFVPELVVESKLLWNDDDASDIGDSKISFNRAWKEYIKPMGRQKNSLDDWYYNCEKICRKYKGKVSNMLKSFDGDATAVYDYLTCKPGGKSTNKEIHRYGEKLAALFLQWVVRYDLYDLTNKNGFGLPVDFQLSRIGIQTGIVIPEGEIYREKLAFEILLPLFKMLCAENDWEPRMVSEALWLIGSEGCSRDVNSIAPYYGCPISEYCSGVIHKLPNDYWKLNSIENLLSKGLFTKWMQDRLI